MLLFELGGKESYITCCKWETRKIDLLSSEDESTERVATNVDCDAIDHESCRNVDSDKLIAETSNVNEQVLPDIVVKAVYPEFYELGINSDKPGDIIESEFLKEDLMSFELIEELCHFDPPPPITQR